MDKKQIAEIVKFFKQRLKKKLHSPEVILFGSYADGTPHQDSDIDLLVVSPEFERKTIFERADLTKDAEHETIRKYLVPLDVMDLSPSEFKNESSLVASFAKNGIRF